MLGVLVRALEPRRGVAGVSVKCDLAARDCSEQGVSRDRVGSHGSRHRDGGTV